MRLAPPIPRTLHQILLGQTTVPQSIRDNIARLQALNPGWVHMLHNDEHIHAHIDQHHGAEVRRAYESINPLYGAARADFFRYLLMYQ